MSDQTPNEAPDGAPTPDATPARDPNETMSREAFQKLVGQRDEGKAKIAALEAQLEAAAQAKPTPTPETPAPDGAPEWFAAYSTDMTAKLDSLTRQLEGQTALSRDGAISKVLDSVPHGNKVTARALLPTLGIELTSPTAVADALAKLRQDHPAVMFDASRGVQPRAPQAGPDGKLNFDAFHSPEDIPPEHHAAAFSDPATLARLRGIMGGGSKRGDGHNI